MLQGGKAPETFKQKNAEVVTREVMAQGFQYRDSLRQVEITSRFDDHYLKLPWKAVVSENVDALFELLPSEKAALKEHAPPSEKYLNMLRVAMTDPILFSWIKMVVSYPAERQKEILNFLLTLYVLFSEGSIHKAAQHFFQTHSIEKKINNEDFIETVKCFSDLCYEGFAADNVLYAYAALSPTSEDAKTATYLIRDQKVSVATALLEIMQLTDAQLSVLRELYADGLRGQHLMSWIPPSNIPFPPCQGK